MAVLQSCDFGVSVRRGELGVFLLRRLGRSAPGCAVWSLNSVPLLPVATSCHPESPCLSLEETKGVRIGNFGKTLIQGALEACSVPKDRSLTERVAQEACKAPAPCVTSVSVRGPESAAMCLFPALQDPLPHLHRGRYPALNLIYSIPLRLSAPRNAPLTSPPETHMPLLLESAPEIPPLPATPPASPQQGQARPLDGLLAMSVIS